MQLSFVVFSHLSAGLFFLTAECGREHHQTSVTEVIEALLVLANTLPLI